MLWLARQVHDAAEVVAAVLQLPAGVAERVRTRRATHHGTRRLGNRDVEKPCAECANATARPDVGEGR